MPKQTGLGRGISNFLKDSKEVEKILEGNGKDILKLIPIDEIKVNSEQARKNFDNNALEELANSIKEFGILEPIILFKDDDKYMIVAGERRFRAAKLANLKEVPSIIKSISKENIDKISLIENIQRENLNIIEEALGYKKIINSYNITQEELARTLGKSRQYIGNTIRLLKLDNRVIEFLEKNLLTASHGKLLLSIKDHEKQFKEAQRIIRNNNTIKETKENIDKKTEDIYLRDTKRTLSEYLGTKVNFKNNGRKGKIEIDYYSDDDLSRICEIILGTVNDEIF